MGILTETLHPISQDASNRTDQLLPWTCKPDIALSVPPRVRKGDITRGLPSTGVPVSQSPKQDTSIFLSTFV